MTHIAPSIQLRESALKHRKTYLELEIEIDCLRKSLEKKWQPMDSAPKDGETWILLFYDGLDRPFIARWQAEIDRWMSFEARIMGEPKQWRPLPELPDGSWNMKERVEA